MTWDTSRQTADTLRLWESVFADGAAEAGGPSVADFRAVGLCEEDACRARNGMTAGMYLTFEDAAVAVSTFSAGSGTRLDSVALRERAAKFDPKTVTEASEGAPAVPSYEDQLREALREPMAAYYGSVSEESLDGRMGTLKSEAQKKGCALAEAVDREVRSLRDSAKWRREAEALKGGGSSSVSAESGQTAKTSKPATTKREISEADARAFLYGAPDLPSRADRLAELHLTEKGDQE